MPQTAERKREYMRLFMRRLRRDVLPRLQQGIERPIVTACAICGRAIEGKKVKYDHDHKTGKFRGWLCSGCNAGLGFFHDNPARLRKAIEYLTQMEATLTVMMAQVKQAEEWSN